MGDLLARVEQLEAELAEAHGAVEAQRAAAAAREQGLSTAVAALGESVHRRETQLSTLREEAEAELKRMAAEVAEARQEAESARATLEQTAQDLQHTRSELHAIRPGGAAIKEKLREAERRQNLETRKSLQRAEDELNETRTALENRQRRIAVLEQAIRHRDQEMADAIAAREAEIETLRQTVDAVRQAEAMQTARANEAHERYTLAARELSDRKQQAAQMEARLAELEPQCVSAQEERDRLQSALASIKQEVDEKRQTARAVVERLAETEEALRQARARLAVIEQEVASSQAARNEIDLARRRAVQAIEELQARVGTQEEQCRKLTECCNELEEKGQSLQGEVGNWRERNEELARTNTRLEAEARDLRAANVAAEREAQSCQAADDAEVERLRKEADDLDRRCRAMEEECAGLRESAAVQAQEAAAEREQQAALIARYEAEATAMHEHGDQTPPLSQDLEARVRELEAMLAERESRIHQLEAQITAAGRILDRLRAQREELKERLVAAGLYAPSSSSR